MSKSRRTDTGNLTEQAMIRRLERLAAMPVDLSRVEKVIKSQIPLPVSSSSRLVGWIRPMRAVAAGFVVMGLIGVLLWSTLGGPVTASAAQMAMIHRQMTRDPASITQVDSMEEASAVLSRQWPGRPPLPQMPEAEVMACCMHSIQNRRVACVQFKEDGAAVTMSVADASDFRSPRSPVRERDGVKYYFESIETLNMVSARRDGRWICLMGELPVDRLIEIAHGLQFE